MIAPPDLRQRSRELLLGRDVARLAMRSRRLRTLQHGTGAPVVLVPGYGATDAALAPLRRFLTRLGHDARPVGMGRISDDVPGQFPVVTERAAAIADETGRAVTLIGWSLGGVLSREAARDRPDAVERVVTFGTPVVGGPAYTAMGHRYDPAYLAEVQAAIAEREQTPITVPVTAFWSRNDGVVAPEACIDRTTPGVENVEVRATHVGMSLDPDVWAGIAIRLAADTASTARHTAHETARSTA
ncbi:MAG: alpha/beta hydrolase [Ilumatobacter sp.]|uniref:alpha/beta fold hydrolase n=1 Tax=Ilumatobacter sp. TaxID=1967498 RepID=UPI002602E06D|nr:alpha/beta hydrolase [Ilumatobacter sp.]MDJ0767853.1 alpha/beta hydrolase [Ilumatobacter sp.]